MDEKEIKIRPKGILRPTETGTCHLPKEIRDELGNPSIIPYVLNAETALLYRPDADPEKILKSLKVLMEDIRLRIKKEDEK